MLARSLLVELLLLVLLSASRAELLYERVHLVDYVAASNAYFFRGNEPFNADHTAVAYDTLMMYMAKRAKESRGLVMPNPRDIFLVDLTFQGTDLSPLEPAFWENNTDKGMLLQWRLLMLGYMPAQFSQEQQRQMINDGSIWRADQLPSRVVALRDMLLRGPPHGPRKYAALVVFCHCVAGCDRTGEFVAAYRMTYLPQTRLLPQYQLDCSECGVCPVFTSTAAVGWYCLTWNLWNATAMHRPALPDCLSCYDCQPGGGCRVVNSSLGMR